MIKKYKKMVEQASVYDVAVKTPLERAAGLSKRLNNEVWIKREDLQPVYSFKLRGAYNKIAHLSDAEKEKGVITASAGNHAQGVALAANRLGLKALIFMPKTTPDIKVSSVRDLGAEIELVGNAYDDAYEHAMDRAKTSGMTFVHPYDDPDIIAGQGTVAKEIIEQLATKPDIVFVPVGGGGLIAGVSAYLKSIDPEIRIVGVEPDDAPCMYEALKAGKRVVLDQVGIFADGVAVKQVGEEPFRVAQTCVDDMVLVSTDEICAAIKDIFDDTRSITEPAGALAVAGMKKYVEDKKINNQRLVAIDSGANINFDRLRHVAERSELGEHREALFAVTIPEEIGSFKKFCELIGLRGMTEFNYRYADVKIAHIFVGIQLQNGLDEKNELLKLLHDNHYVVEDMTDNEMAKLHVRYMVGGHGNGVENERLFRFEFPERPGALLRFLNYMGERWNISLFHYRNHGAAYGRVLAGIQVPKEDNDELQIFLQNLGYSWWEETSNPAYAMFLS
ncbi:MAG: threonine ammonia-lyase, biosynthetic [Gammaproteobacteria bacterium]|nr:threonine ammonia-lyase, biosynthetic [Gammaproteobacteria bacterium]